MIKKVFLLSSVAAIIIFSDACTKDKTPVPDCVQADSVNTYTNSVKGIMDVYCAFAGCHDAITHFNDVYLDTYEHTLDAARNNAKFFCSIDHTCTPFMPYVPYPKLADSLIVKIKAWRENCYAP